MSYRVVTHASENLNLRTDHGYCWGFTGRTYRLTDISGWTHVDEYVAACGEWVWLGHAVTDTRKKS